MLRLENVAMPFTAATESVPLSVPLPGFVPMATVIMLVAEVTVLPCASCTVTCTAGVMEEPAVVFVGRVVKASLLAAPAGMLNALLVEAGGAGEGGGGGWAVAV